MSSDIADNGKLSLIADDARHYLLHTDRNYDVIVSDATAFAARYPAVPAAAIAGQFSGNLSNDGEQLVLTAANGSATFAAGTVPAGVYDVKVTQAADNSVLTGAFEVRGKHLGIVGYGHIGTQVGMLAEALGMRVFFHDTNAKLALGNATGIMPWATNVAVVRTTASNTNMTSMKGMTFICAKGFMTRPAGCSNAQ